MSASCTVENHFATTLDTRPPQNKDHLPGIAKLHFFQCLMVLEIRPPHSHYYGKFVAVQLVVLILRVSFIPCSLQMMLSSLESYVLI